MRSLVLKVLLFAVIDKGFEVAFFEIWRIGCLTFICLLHIMVLEIIK